MDPFTQRMLDKAEQRSRALGISNAGKYPLAEFTESINASNPIDAIATGKEQQSSHLQHAGARQQHGTQSPKSAPAQASTTAGITNNIENCTGVSNRLQVVEKPAVDLVSTSTNAKRVHRQFTAVDKENMDLGIEINIMTDKDVEVQVQVEEQEIVKDGPDTSSEHSLAKIRDTSRSRLQRLGALYANPNDLSSPIHRTEGNFCADSPAEETVENSIKRVKQRYGKLAELASSINEWEDDISHHDPHPISIMAPPKPDLPSRKISDVPPPKPALPSRSSVVELACTSANSSPFLTKANGDSKIREKVAALVASASTMGENKIKAEIHKQRQEDMQILAKRFNKQKEVFRKDEEHIVQPVQMKTPDTKQTTKFKHPPTPPPPPPMPNTSSNATNKRHSPGDATCDDESKRARKSGENITQTTRLYPALSDLESESDRDNGGTTATVSEHGSAGENMRMLTAAPETDNAESYNDEGSFMESEDADDSSIDICNGSLGRVIMQVVQQNDHQQQQHQSTKQRKEVHYADNNDYYGCADSSMNSSDASMGVDDYLDEALEDGNDSCAQESGVNADDGDGINPPRESKGTAASNSFSFHKTPKKYTNCQSISEENEELPTSTAGCTPHPVKSELSINRDNDDKMVTLVHTVSFYRRQQSDNSASSTPVRKVCREQQVLRSDIGNATRAAMQFDSPKQQEINFQKSKHDETYVVEEGEEEEGSPFEESDADDDNVVQEKIKKLLDEVCKQQTVIAQTSQALNLCAATVEFSGSTESVEGERHLLVATHRRQACLDEVQRLRVEKCLRPVGALRDNGRLTVKEITIPLRQDYIRKLAADTISGHHLVCLLKYNEHVLATKSVPTLPGLLAVKFPDVLQMNNVYADFRITLEIYGMTAQREVLPHEVKYHINLNKKSGIKTPKKKGSENRLVMPPVQSPAGPNVVRTPALVQYGFAIFSLREIQRTSWTLTQVLGVSPLEGVVHMKANCELSVLVEHRGFLTMFEDISGFGAWHRRWCYLNGSVLNYWKYPDDERKKTPIGSIDLYACRTQKVTVAPRDICARLNTMLLEFERPARENDEESLIIIPNGRTTIVRYLLSADTKEERELWCAYFNKVLLLLRAWGSPQ
ncbi:anillin [Rhagoletis pomonella]|uniref:anillin n=1 Tax=Rhagoletis pomonella TaxID=28610 RepID=UPI001785AA59|nr:anillin [Rhagoletis pomonella]